MKLALDGHWLEDFSGVSTYCRRIYLHLPRHLGPDGFSVVTRTPQGMPNEVVLPASSAYRWEQIAFPLHLARGGGDAAFFPDWRNGWFQPRPYVVTLHDLTFFTHPHLYRATRRMRLLPIYRRWLSRTLTRARAVITVSEYSRKTILSFFPRLEGRLHAVYNGVDEAFRPAEDPGGLAAFRRDVLGFDEPYVLNVGRFDYNKNLLFLCRAFLESRAAAEHRLVLCGRRVNAHYEEVTGYLRDHDRKGRVSILPGVGNEDLVRLYQGAALFVMPSLSEGFGIPILEAMACGVPALAADNTSLPEVMGEVDGLFDSADLGSLKARLEAALGDTGYRSTLMEAGARNVVRFNWDRCAAETAAVLRLSLAG